MEPFASRTAASEQGLSLGQRLVESKSNEIEAIPHLLEILDLEGTVVTIDAAGTQKTIAKQIVDNKADYVLALKKNHPKLYAAVAERFLEATDQKEAGVKHIRQRERSHGRDETRDYYQTPVPNDLPGRHDWAGLKTLGMVIRTWVDQTNGKEKSAIRYYVSSLRIGVREVAKHVRNHWPFLNNSENSLHWVLDVAFREDECPIENATAAANLSAMNRIALSALKSDTSIKRSIKGKRKNAGWDGDYLTHILQIATAS